MFRKPLLFLFLLLAFKASAQQPNYIVFKGDTINRKDPKGLKQGEWRKYYRNDTLYTLTFFKNDKPVEVSRTYYESGKLKAEVKFDKSGIKSRAISYYENGKILAKGNYVNLKKDSVWTYYAANDSVKSIESYNAGVANGTWKVFYEDGKVAEEKKYMNGKREGAYRQFDVTGTLILEMAYKNDKEDGPIKLYHVDGKIRQTGTYVKGLKEGVWLEYDGAGAVLKREVYKNDTLIEPKEKKD